VRIPSGAQSNMACVLPARVSHGRTWPVDQELLRGCVHSALCVGLRFASRHLLDGDDLLAADKWHPDDLAVDERDRLLNFIANGAEFTGLELERHLGSPPIPADRRTHLAITEEIRKHFPHSYVVGEEASDPEWDMAQEAPTGSLIFQIDAIDGSLPYETLTFGYSVNILAYERQIDRDELLVSALANSSGFMAMYQEGVGVTAGSLDDQRRLTEPLSTEYNSESIAALGALPRHRVLIEPLLRDDFLTVFTSAGAPAAFGIILGKLAVLVATKNQTTHDAAFLPIVASMGLPILVDGGLVLGVEDVKNLFSHVARRQKDRRDRPIPRFVVARNPIVGASIARRLFSSPVENER